MESPGIEASARAHKWSRGPGCYLFAATGVLVAGLLWMGVHPGFYYMIGIFLVIFAWFVMLVVLVLRLGVQSVMVNRAANSSPKPLGDGLRYAGVIGLFAVATSLLFFTVPMKLGFLAAEPALSRLVNKQNPAASPELSGDIRVGPYVLSAEMTNSRRSRWPDKEKRVLFILADDHEAGFIYRPSGIDDLDYNSGNKGRLFGNWYWMKED